MNRQYTIEINSIKFFAVSLAYRIFLDALYRHFISTTYRYVGFHDNFGALSFVLSIFLLAVASMSAYKFYRDKKRFSSVIMLLLFFLSFIPFTSMVAFNAVDGKFTLCNTFYWLWLFWLCSRKKRWKIPALGIKKRLMGETAIQIITVLSIAIVLFVSGYYAHFRINFNLDLVYDLREEAKLNSLPTILVYLFSWTKLVNVVLIAYFLRKKKYIWSAVLVAAQLLSFGYDGMKSTLFSTLIVIPICFIPKSSLRHFNKWIVFSLSFFVVMAAILYFQFRSTVLTSMFVRRVMYLPVLLSSCFVDFFSTHTPDFFRASFLRHFGFSTPYPGVAKMIAGIYFNRPNMNANNGMIADAFTNLGYLGIIVMPMILSFVLQIIDAVSADYDPRLYIALSIPIASSLINSFILTILLTHGLLVVMVIFSFMRRDEAVIIGATSEESY